MHLLFAALLEGQQTHSETVTDRNDKGVWAAGVACVADALNFQTDYTNGLDECVGRLQRRLPQGKSNWKYILVRAGILQTWRDVLDLRVTYIFISFKKSYEWGGEGKEKGVLEVQFSIFNLSLFHTIYGIYTSVRK